MMRIFLRFFLPMFLLLMVLFFGLRDAAQKSVYKNTVLEGSYQLEFRKNLILNLINPLIANTIYLSESNILKVGFHDEDGQKPIVEDLIYFARTHPQFEQLRILDTVGKEVLRVNNYGGNLRVVDKKNLQLKGHRDYFQRALELGPEEVYISNVDLNREYDTIDKPYHAVIRIISRINDKSSHERIGFFVTNVSLENLMASDPLSRNDSGRMMLLNSRGEGVSKLLDDYRYRFSEAPEYKTIQDTLPELWNAIKHEKKGQLKTESGIYVFTTLNLIDQLNQRPSLKHVSFYKNEDSRVVLVSYVPFSNSDLFGLIGEKSWWLMLALLGLFVIFSLAFTRKHIREKNMYGEIGSLNDELIKSQYALNSDRNKLEEAIAQLTKRNIQLREFSQIISHNIRSPIAGLAILVDYLTEEGEKYTPAEREEIHKKLKHSVQGLNALAEDLLEVVNVLDTRDISTEEVSMRLAIDKARDLLMEQIIASGAQLQTDLSGWEKLKYNRFYLESIILNLMSNALKYRSKERTLVMELQTYEEDGRKKMRFSDNGRGINLDWHGDNVFGLHKTFHRNASGKGVGLFMTKTQINSLGGTIEVESEEGKGATFIVTF